ncbi:signal peptidase I, partial [Candidatus Woesebacteria bacterium RIFOXYA1_FULL_38_9]
SFYTYNGIALTEGQTLTLGTNEYFVMGDNREHSFDSRHFGIVERSKITGKAWFIYWPPSDIGIVPKAEEY